MIGQRRRAARGGQGQARPGWLATAGEAVAEVIDSPAVAATDRRPIVSVVIPTYQHGHLVGQAVAAALAQTLAEPFEVIVVDDGSTDDTGRVLRELARATAGQLRYLRLGRNRGRSAARNAGIAQARGDVIAFTDSDCCPTPAWLAEGLATFDQPAIGVVQGRTIAHPEQPQPLFSHFIETTRLDGTFCTSNILYRRELVLRVGGFDPAIPYWQDADLGWRIARSGCRVAFAERALVYHQVLPISPQRWLRWPLHFESAPAIAARYPEHRRYLFLGLWVDWFHALLSLGALSIALARLLNRRWLLLGLPYLLAFPFRHGLRGRWPPVKALCHLAWDAIALGVLIGGSIRHRTPVL